MVLNKYITVSSKKVIIFFYHLSCIHLQAIITEKKKKGYYSCFFTSVMAVTEINTLGFIFNN